MRILPSLRPTGDNREVNEAMDAVASVLRAFGKHGFDTENTAFTTFSARCESWARHVLIGTPPRVDSDDDADPPNGDYAGGIRREWLELLRFVQTQRQDEVTYVKSRLGGFRNLITELVASLRDAVVEDDRADAGIRSQLAEIQAALESDSLEELRAKLPEALTGIRTTLDKRRSTVRNRLQSLGTQLSDLKGKLAATRRDAETDPLTKLYNRGAFAQAFEQTLRLSIASAEPLVLAVIDLDHFKRVNDTYGHQTGDLVLQRTADCIVRTFPRKNDFVARYGGEEFAVLLKDVDERAAHRLIRRLLDNIRRLAVHTDQGALSVTCSVGYTQLQADDTGATFFERADQALYRAKKQGRDRAVLHPVSSI